MGHNKINLSEIDCVFISYDEPNAEKNWIDLEEKCFWAQRVHGVKGSDECHKAAANLANSEWFITVDADNIVDPKFFELELDLDTFPETVTFSWPGLNIVNGLRYGNGSLKVWRKDFVLDMKSHEAADVNTSQVDFCWEERYRPMVDSYSKTYINGSPYQAWRAGFREGVKMSLVGGVLPKERSVDDLLKNAWHNVHRLKIWMSLGSHVDNGMWAMLGARHGCWKANCTDWNYVDVRDFEKLKEIWKEVADTDVLDSVVHYGKLLSKDFGLDVPMLPADASSFVIHTFDEQYKQIVEQITWTVRRNRV